MPVGTTMEGDKIVDPRFPPLPEGPLGIPTLQSPTPQEEMEEGQIPLLMEGVLEMSPPFVGEKKVLVLPILIVIEDIPKEQEHHEV